MATVEEENYVRISLLLTGISPRAVRHYFDIEFDPSCLERTMRQGRKTLTDLKIKRIINQSQWNLLYPISGLPDSTNFDVTLMMTLLKNLASIPIPDKSPIDTDNSIGAALGRIKYYRNQLAHMKDSRVDNSQFENMWAILAEAVKVLGGVSMYDETTKLKTMVLDRTNKEIMLAIKQSNEEIKDLRQMLSSLTTELESLKSQCQTLQQEPDPWNIRETFKSELQAWKKEDKMFAVTSQVRKILKCCKKNLCVTITGNSGMGKTVTLRHVALIMAEKGYDVIPVHDPDVIKHYFNPKKKTLFVVDDFCGKYSADKIQVSKWENISNIFKYIDTNIVRIIVCCRLQVYQDELFGTLSMFNSCVCNMLLKDYKFTEEDIKTIGSVYAQGHVAEIVEYAHLYDCFPLLCKLYSNKPSLGLGFFQHPFTVYETELDQMYTTQNYVSYCALALCVMLNNCVEEKVLTDEISHELRSVFENTFEACKLNRGTSRIQIRDALNILTNTYISNEGNVYKAIHDKIFDFLSFYFGKKMITCLIGNADINWISERLLLDEYKCGLEPEFTVIVNSQHRLLLVERLVKEWSKGQIKNVFYSINMTKSNFRKYFLSHIQSLDNAQQTRLAQTTDILTELNVLIVCCFYGDKPWINWCFHHGIGVNVCAKEGLLPIHTACLNIKEQIDVVHILLEKKADINQSLTNGTTPLYLACLNGHAETVRILLDNKADINQCTTDIGVTPLYIACQNGITEIVKMLLENKADINQCTTDNGVTPLYAACENGNMEIVKILIENKADINQCTTDNGVTPLFVACNNGKTEIVQMLIENKADINQCTTDSGATPLYIACQNGNTEIVKMLIEDKADINQCTTDKGATPLYVSCVTGNTQIVEMLLENKADINQCTTDNGATPLHVACETGNTEILKMLLENKADINQCTTDFGATPLYVACNYGNTDIVKVLLENKADINQCTTDQGDTPLYIACKNGNTEIVKMLLENKADINQCTTDIGATPLYIACQNGNTEIVKMLLENKADINRCTTDIGATPLYIACETGNTEIVKMLIENQADINQCTTDNGATPLHLACKNGFIEIVKLFIENKADINQLSAIGMTPLFLACHQGHIQLVRLLIDNNVDILNFNVDYSKVPFK